MGWGYDLLYNDLTSAEREKYKAKLIKQSNLMYEFFKPKNGKNLRLLAKSHVYSGDGSGDCGLRSGRRKRPKRKIGRRLRGRFSTEFWRLIPKTVTTMKEWNTGFSRLRGSRIISTRSFTQTGENLYETTPGLELAYKYVSHATLPGGEFNFDYGDIYAGNITRSRKGGRLRTRTKSTDIFARTITSSIV